MFQNIYSSRASRALIKCTVTVIPLLNAIREIIRANGLRSHKFEYLAGARSVIVTGIPIRGRHVAAPRSLHERIKSGYLALNPRDGELVMEGALDRLLSALGTHRYIVGRASEGGKRSADRMNVLRRRRAAIQNQARQQIHKPADEFETEPPSVICPF
jgi:hypothetical protein